jgi:hypothetical protein
MSPAHRARIDLRVKDCSPENRRSLQNRRSGAKPLSPRLPLLPQPKFTCPRPRPRIHPSPASISPYCPPPKNRKNIKKKMAFDSAMQFHVSYATDPLRIRGMGGARCCKEKTIGLPLGAAPEQAFNRVPYNARSH